MKTKRFWLLAVSLFGCTIANNLHAQEDYLLETAQQIQAMKAQSGTQSLFAQQVDAVAESLAPYLSVEVDIPVPKDAGGGYTHETHKKNGQTIRNAGRMYLLTGNKAYLELTKDMLTRYAILYPTLGLHPQQKEQSPGTLFWQSLNEAVFLVYAIQGYDAVKEALSENDRKQIEAGLFTPMVNFLSVGQPNTFDKIHNHGTWATAAVGMTGYVMGNQDWVEQALYGLDKSGTGGYMRQLDELFSPEGYYNEGPYYQRYALMPFVLFAQAIAVNEPQRNIFDYRNGILLKAIKTTVDLSYNGLFFPFNDALKDKGIKTIELVHGVAIAYEQTQNPQWLDIAKTQETLLLTGPGLSVASAIEAGKSEPYSFTSQIFGDGKQGDEGALIVLRANASTSHQTLVFKATSQGLGHGHFDKLNWQFYDQGNEIVTDYGAARFLNVEAKYGGHYLPENNAFAKQTVAHNTLVVDEISHFNGNTKTGNRYHPDVIYFEQKGPLQIAKATMENAYDEVTFSRTMAMIDREDKPAFIIDWVEATGNEAHQFDLPLYYSGHHIYSNLNIESDASRLYPVGDKNGYQYLWHKGSGTSSTALVQTTFLNERQFYSLTTINAPSREVVYVQVGANDPNFNLRPENGFILRDTGNESADFVSIFEPHGNYDPTLERTVNSYSQVKHLEKIELDKVTVIVYQFHNQPARMLALASTPKTASEQTAFVYNGKNFSFSGNAEHFLLENEL